MIIGWNTVSKEAFRGLVEAYVLSNYSEVGDLDQSLATKTQNLMHEVQAGRLCIWFDADHGQVNLLTAEQARQLA